MEKKWKFIHLPAYTDARGALCAVDTNAANLPFRVERVFWIYDVPAEAQRGGHAHRTCGEILFAIHGTLKVTIDDGLHSEIVALSDPSVGLYIPPMVWCNLHDFSPQCACLCMASEPYMEEGYIHDKETFLHETAVE